MLSFLQLMEDIPHTIHRSEHGIIYAHKISDHHILTHFLPRGGSGGDNHYDVHFTRHKEGKQTDGFSRRGMSQLSSEDRIKSIRSVTGAINHFVKTEKPSALTASSNTKDKSDFSNRMLSKMGERNGSTVKSNGKDTTIHFH